GHRSCRRNSRFFFLAFRSPRFPFRLLRFGQRPKFHHLCLHRTIRHFVIRTSHFLIRDYLLHRCRLATLGDDRLVGDLKHTRVVLSRDGKGLRFVIHRRNQPLKRGRSHFATRRSRCIGGGSRRALSIRRRRAFCFGITPRRQEDRNNREERADD